jgi:tRNA(Ile)-lysidine synthase
LGLSCMKLEHAGIVRPLLHYSKSDIFIYARKNKLKWREDKSNASNAYSRNRLRNEFLPFVSSNIPTLRDSVLELIHHFQATQEELELKIAPILEDIYRDGKLLRSAFHSLSEEAQVELLRQLTLSATYLPRLQQLTERGKQIPIAHPLFEAIVSDLDHFTFVKLYSTPPKIGIEPLDSLPNTFDKSSIYLDADKLSGPLKVRKWQVGDRISPIGMSGSQLISDVIKDAKIDGESKKNVSVLHDDQAIHWCIGLKIGRLAVATSDTANILRCSISDSRVEE